MGSVVTRVDPGRGAAGRTHEASDPARFAPPIDGLVFRGFRGIDADLPGMFEANRLGRMADGELEPIEYGGMRASYEHLERSDPTTDILVLELHGEICGYARVDWADTNEGDRTYNSIVSLRPDARRREIRSGALRWAEERRRAIAAAHALAPSDAPEAPGGRPSWLSAFSNDGDIEAGLLLEAAGYRRHRRFFSMLRPNLDDIPDLPLPDGLEVKPITSDPGQMRQVFDSDTEAFRDHYGSPASWTTPRRTPRCG
jgi:mycothiol synthase